MARLVVRFPNFGDVFDGSRMRAFIQHLEQLFARVRVDQTVGAYTATADLTIGATDDVVLVDTSAATVTVTLPEISDTMVRDKFEVEIVKVAAANALIVAPTGADTILGEPDARVSTQWTALRFRATADNWVLV